MQANWALSGPIGLKISQQILEEYIQAPVGQIMQHGLILMIDIVHLRQYHKENVLKHKEILEKLKEI